MELESGLEAATQRNVQLEEEVRELHEKLKEERDKYNVLWRMNCEQLTQYDSVVASKEEEIVSLGARLAALESESRSRKDTLHPDLGAPGHATVADEGRPVVTHACPLREPVHGGPGHRAAGGGAPPIAWTHPTLEHTRLLHGGRSEHGESGSIHTRSHHAYQVTGTLPALAGERSAADKKTGTPVHVRTMPAHTRSGDSAHGEVDAGGPSDSVSFVVHGRDLPVANGNPRRGKAPPVDPFSGETADLAFEDWLPALQRAAEWNQWSDSETLIQLAGHLRGRALQEWSLLRIAEKESLKVAIDALRSRLDPGSRALAAQDFRHASQCEGESVADYIRRLEQLFRRAYGRERMSDETRETLLHGQLQEGLCYELMKAPAVSGSHTFRESHQ